jgi:hypothetical protein
MNRLLFKITSLLLLTFFCGDTLAIWDALERFGIGFHQLSIDGATAIEFHHHDADDTAHADETTQHKTDTDTCTLCPCCVTNVHMIQSDFNLFVIFEGIETGDVTVMPLYPAFFATVFHPPTDLLS